MHKDAARGVSVVRVIAHAGLACTGTPEFLPTLSDDAGAGSMWETRVLWSSQPSHDSQLVAYQARLHTQFSCVAVLSFSSR
jgi:hypothetical protein